MRLFLSRFAPSSTSSLSRFDYEVGETNPDYPKGRRDRERARQRDTRLPDFPVPVNAD